MHRFLYQNLFAAIAIFWAFIPSFAADSADTKLKVATFMDFPPFISKTEKDGGVISAIVNESFAASGIEIETPLIPWRRAYRAVERGEQLASYSWAYSDQRANDFYLSTPIFAISNQIITTYDDITNWQQLRERRPDGNRPILCIPIGWKISPEFADLVDSEMIRQVTPGHPKFCLDLIRANRTNILYMPRMTARYYLQALLAEDNDPGAPAFPKLYSLDIPSGRANTQHVIFTRNEEGRAWKEKFDAGFNILMASGRYREILDKYLTDYTPSGREDVYSDQKSAGILP